MVWLTFILSGLKWIRANWRLCATLAFACAAAAALLYARHRWIEEGRTQERSKYEALAAKARAEMAEKDRRNAVAQATAFANGQAIGERRVRDQQDLIAERDRTIAGLRAGTVRLHDRWQACLSGPEAGDAADPASRPDGADELRREIAGQISEADDADSRVKRLQEFVQVQQRLCQEIQ